MCGIFAYTGTKNAAPILLDGLQALEYRGYDSAGIFLPRGGTFKSIGIVKKLRRKIPDIGGTSGIAHTRWATHGIPNEKNAHPHHDCKKNIWIVHNGIIENHKTLRSELEQEGHVFYSDTDSEVITHLIEREMSSGNTLYNAVLNSIKKIEGTYGVAVMDARDPSSIVAVRMGSPIVLGIGERENIIASDPAAVLRHTKEIIFLNDGEIALIKPLSYSISTLDNKTLNKTPETIEWDIEDAQKGGYEHFMMKEIMEQPETIKNALRGRVIVDQGLAKLGGLEHVEDRLRKIDHIIIVGCGSAYYAGLVGKYLLEEYGGIKTDIDVASELRYREMILGKNTAVLAVSQSGETADTLTVIKEAKRRGALTLGIVNSVGSTIARETDAGVYNHAGPEIGVASTKAFISQISVFFLIALFLGRQRHLSASAGRQLIKELLEIPEKVQKILNEKEKIKDVAEKYAQFHNFLFIGRKYNFPISYEGALKLKEVSYIHAEGYGAGEMKHGPIALIDENFPTIAIAPNDSVHDKMASNIEEIKARSGPIFGIGSEDNVVLASLVDDLFLIPKTIEPLYPLLTTIPLQLFAYYAGVSKGYNVDKPRNLAKSVTVE